jgi:hypothetical protein
MEEKLADALAKVYEYAKSIGIIIVDTNELNPFFKGDLNGINIWISSGLHDDEELFNVLHLMGHTIQWNVDADLRALGSVLHSMPSDETLFRLQKYEWEANCYGLYILHKVGVYDLDEWLTNKYTTDMLYLTHYYKTGEKLKEVTDIALANEFTWPLSEKEIPMFTPYPNPETRNGIVIDFDAV